MPYIGYSQSYASSCHSVVALVGTSAPPHDTLVGWGIVWTHPPSAVGGLWSSYGLIGGVDEWGGEGRDRDSLGDSSLRLSQARARTVVAKTTLSARQTSRFCGQW